MLRRDVLKTIGLAAGSIALGREALAAGDDLSVAITLEGKTLIFSAAAGKDLGDYKSPRFVQRCIRTDHPDSALSVFFRPDRDGVSSPQMPVWDWARVSRARRRFR